MMSYDLRASCDVIGQSRVTWCATERRSVLLRMSTGRHYTWRHSYGTCRHSRAK